MPAIWSAGGRWRPPGSEVADKYLAGNGRPCAACGGGGLVPPRAGACLVWPCPACDGLGRVPIPPAEIIAAHLAAMKKGPG